MSRKTNSSGRRLIFLSILAVAAWWYFARWVPRHDYRVLSGRLEYALNEELASFGLGDAQLAQQVRKERSQWGMVWVETSRRFSVPRTVSIPRLLDRLSAIAGQEGCQVSRREEASRQAMLEIRKDVCLLQRLVLVPPGAAPEAKPPALFHPPQIALVIDDVAYDFDPMDRFADLGVPLTFAVLPRDTHSRDLAEKAQRMNFAVILHLPMEPLDLRHNNPGSAALYLKMSPAELRRQFEKDVASVPHIQGINNHMGSAFTSDEDKMNLVLQWVKEKHLFFLDSHTSPHSVVSRVARRVGVPCLVNEIFLDNEDSAAAIEHQLDLAMRLALTHQQTIAIGHYRRKHLVEALASRLPVFREKGIQLVTLPTLYNK